MPESTADAIQIKCDGCSARFRVPAAAIGKKAKCPKCSQAFVVAPQITALTPAAAADDKIKFACDQCGKSLRVPAASAGKRVKCPQCQSIQNVPARDMPEPASAAAAGGDDDLLGALGAVVPPAPVVQRATRPCPKCRMPIELGTPVCFHCGSDLIAGASSFVKSPAGKAERGGKSAIGLLKGFRIPGGPLMSGITASAIGAVIGAGIWFAIAKATGYELGYVAWGLGGLTGLGMFAGTRGASPGPAGIISALMSLGGIVLAKLGIVVFILLPIFDKEINADKGKPRDELIAIMASDYEDEMADEQPATQTRKPTKQKASDAKFELEQKAKDKARTEVAKLSDQEVQTRLEAIHSGVESHRPAVIGILMVASFLSLWNVIFVVLAVGTAFRIGAYGPTLTSNR